MCEFIGKSNERILWKLSKSEILRLYSIVHVAMETTKTSNFACQSKFFIIIFFTCQVSACELQPFSCHNLANDLYSETAKTVFSHLKKPELFSRQLKSKITVKFCCLILFSLINETVSWFLFWNLKVLMFYLPNSPKKVLWLVLRDEIYLLFFFSNYPRIILNMGKSADWKNWLKKAKS